MDTRCPRCAASVRADAPWCSLCFAALEAGAPATRAMLAPVQVAQPIAVTVPAAGPDTAEAARPAPTGPPAGSAPTTEPTWPCGRCEQRNPLAATECSTCGAPFLDGANPPIRWDLPLVGNLLARSRGQQFLIAAVASVVMIALVVGALALIGTVA